MAHDEVDRQALGRRLAGARKLADLTIQGTADKLGLSKATVGAWEVGRNVPDALVLKQLARLYRVTSDTLLWDSPTSIEAIQFAIQFDALGEGQRRAFRAMWAAYLAGVAPVRQDGKPPSVDNFTGF